MRNMRVGPKLVGRIVQDMAGALGVVVFFFVVASPFIGVWAFQ